MNRRKFLQSGAASAAGALTFGTRRIAMADDTITVGFLAVYNWNDYGYTQSHLESAEALAEMSDVQVLKEEGVPEAVEVQKAMKSMIELSGASVIVATAWGYYDPHVLEVAQEYPDVYFLHCGGIWEPGQPENVATYFAYTDEAAYVAGHVAGRVEPSGRFGFVGSKPIPEVLRVANAFTLGARSVNPDATTNLVLTGDWTNPVREAEAANNLIDQGMKVISCDVDIPKVLIETCAQRNVYCTGMHVNQRDLAPEWFLTGVEWNWVTPVRQFVEAVRTGGPFEHNMRGGLAADMVKVSPYGESVSDDIRASADEVIEQIRSGSLAIYSGEIRDNEGNVIVAAGEVMPVTEPSLELTDWLVEGISGSTT